MRTTVMKAFIFAFLWLGLGCYSPTGDVGDPCRNRSECREGLKCGNRTCYDPTATGTLTEENPISSTQEAMVTCAKSRACRTHGRCSADVAGGCVPTLSAHCENSTVGCKKRKRCTFVPEQNECCTDKTGRDCNPKLGDRVRYKPDEQKGKKP